MKDLLGAYFTVADFVYCRDVEFKVKDLKEAGATAGELKAAGCTAKQLLDVKFSLSEVKALKYTLTDIAKSFDRKLTELKKQGVQSGGDAHDANRDEL